MKGLQCMLLSISLVSGQQQMFGAQQPTYYTQEVTWANVLPVLQQRHEERALRSFPGDCDRQISKTLPVGTVRQIKSIIEFMDLFKTSYNTQEEI